MIEQARKHLRAIVNDAPMYCDPQREHRRNSSVHGYICPDEQLETADTDLKIVDMREYVSISSDEKEIESWSLTSMREKFTLKPWPIFSKKLF